MSSAPIRAPAARRLSRPAGGGFTVVEVVVALMMLVSGALAVVAASSAAVRAVGSAEAQLLAMAAAQSRLEALASNGCSGAESGTWADPSAGLREWWEVSRARNGLRLARDSIEYLDHGISRFIVRRRLIVC